MKLSTADQHRLLQHYGPWAVVTGATSGIGLELAERLAEAGLHLVLNARSADQLAALSQRLQATYPIQTRVVAADLGTNEGPAALLAATATLDVGLLVASAGFGTSGEFAKSDLAQETAMLRLNCASVLTLTHHFSQIFAQQKRGGIILLSSIVAFQGVPYSAHYAATKAYIQSLAEGLASELRPLGVDVLAAAPGPVGSGFASRANLQMDFALTPQQVGVPILRALGRQTTVLPGWFTKVLAYSLSTVPRWAKVRIMKMVMGGMTQHQRG